MSGVISALSAIFWGLILLSVLVFIHEGGHYLAARAFGIRVKEFYLGLPCRFNLHVTSKKIGCQYGVTPLLLGGYTMVCGMEETDSTHLAQVLACVQAHGTVSFEDVAKECKISEEDALDALACLVDWGSIEQNYAASNEKPSESEYPYYFSTLERDGDLKTKYDKGHNFQDGKTTEAGVAREVNMTPDEFLAHERSRTYLSRGFWGRTLILVSGIAINIVFGLVLIVCALSLFGLPTPQNVNRIGTVESGSLAQHYGLAAGDTIEVVNGEPTQNWQELSSALANALSGGESFDIVVLHDNSEQTISITPNEAGQKLGISAPVETVRTPPAEAVGQAFQYVGATAAYIAQLFQPDKFVNVIENSTSVVGISVLASDAVSQGIASFILLAAAVSLSLGFMNLLPIPPLDGGRVLIEAIQAIIKKTIPPRVVNIISYVGIALFLLLFVVLLRQDIIRFILGG